MPGVTATTLSVSFSEAEARESRIILQQMRKAFNGLGALEGRCFSNGSVTYEASVGKVERGSKIPQEYTEQISFSNSNSASLSKPGAQSVSIEYSVLRPPSGLTYDSETESVVTSNGTQVYGKAIVKYTAIYEVFFYYPYVQSIPWGGVTIQLGTVFAYNDTTVEALDMELDFNQSKDWVEYARVTSKIVLDPKGTWEFPPNWQSTFSSNRSKIGDERQDYPPDGEFPNTTDTVDGTNCFVDERVHMIVEVNSIGSLQYKDFNNGGDGYWAWENPYFGDSNYDPAYEIQFAEPPGGSRATSAEEFRYDLNHRTWRDAFLDVDKTALIAKLQNEYPGATTYSRSR